MNLCTQYAELAGFDFDILPYALVGLVYFYRFRENISERLSIIALSLVRVFGAILLFKFMFDESGGCFFMDDVL